jgi:hypothetical protein
LHFVDKLFIRFSLKQSAKELYVRFIVSYGLTGCRTEPAKDDEGGLIFCNFRDNIHFFQIGWH